MKLGKEPHEVAITPNANRVLVCNAQDNTVSVIDSNIEVATIPTERYPHGVAITPDGKKAYVAVYGENVVAVVDLKTLNVIKRIPTGLAPDGIAIAPRPVGLSL